MARLGPWWRGPIHQIGAFLRTYSGIGEGPLLPTSGGRSCSREVGLGSLTEAPLPRR